MPQLRPALAQARASIRSEQSLRSCLPPRIANAVHSIHSSGLGLVICVTSAEAAHMVRLLRPEIEAAFAAKGLKFNEISLTVQSRVAEKRRPRAIPSQPEVANLMAQAEKLESERLHTSAERFARTLSDSRSDADTSNEKS